MKELRAFAIMGEPRGKGRPRFSGKGGFVRTYTDEATRKYEREVSFAYNEVYGEYEMFAEDVPLAVEITAFYKIPTATSKKKKELMLLGEVRPTKKPDIDNVGKIILDSLNGQAFADDKQVVSLKINKYYSDEPKVVVTIIEDKPSKVPFER